MAAAGTDNLEGPSKFIADAMLGKLARWMRVMGCDVEYFPVIDDAVLVARAAESDRLILTRDTLLVRRRDARHNHLLVQGDHFRDQLRQVVLTFHIDPLAAFLTRCLECNTLLAPIDREAAKRHVPHYVYATQPLFRTCSSCGRIYWGGTQKERMAEELRSILAS